jgi:hypothetical protein
MNMTLFTVFDRVSGEVRNSGGREAKYLPTDTETHRVLVGVRVDPGTHRIDPVTLQPEPLAISKREAWRATLTTEPDEQAVVLEALKAKLTPAELVAAKVRLKARGKLPA